MVVAAFGFHASYTQNGDDLDPDSPFGIVEPHDAPDQAGALGVSWGRARFHWGAIQPDGPDQWVDAEFTDDDLQNESIAGREIVGLLIGIPDWAQDTQGLPSGLHLPIDDPNNLWAGFVRQIVTRYRGDIDHWIIWNEPDVWDSTHPGFTWPGDEQDFIQLMRVSYLVAKDANPDTVILLGAMSHWWDALYDRELYIERLLDALIADPDASTYSYYYDVMTLHLYFNPGDVHDIIQQYTAIQQEHGIEKPIWLVETNAAPSSDPDWPVAEPTFRVSLLEQAAYQPQALSLAVVSGADRIGIYKLVDTPGDYAANPEPFALVRADLMPRPGYRAAQIAIEQLSNASDAVWIDRGAVSQVVSQNPGKATRILWSRLPVAQSVTLPALATSADVIDMWGNAQTVEAESGNYHLTLFAGECQETVGDFCMIGGPPVYVVEQTQVPYATLDLSVQISDQTGSLELMSDPRPSIGLLSWGMAGLIGAGLATPGILRRRQNRA